jgi:uncharacterized protein YjbJ (UPF0337 family)
MAKQASDLGRDTAVPRTATPQSATRQAKDLTQEAKEQVQTLAQDAKEQAAGLAGQARDHVQTLVGRQKDQAADRLGALAGALREAGRKLEDGEQGGDFGQYVDRAAGQVERLSGYLRNTDLRGFVRDTESFARRRPELFLGGSLVAGLMLARFLKSSGAGKGTTSVQAATARAAAAKPSRGPQAPQKPRAATPKSKVVPALPDAPAAV